jgi:hypothetical protein
MHRQCALLNFFYLSNARRFYSSMGKLFSLMGLTIWNTRYTGWQSGNYLVTTVCCFPCTGKVPCIMATFDYYTIKHDDCTNGSSVSGLELSHIVLVFPSSFFRSKLQNIIYSCFIFQNYLTIGIP